MAPEVLADLAAGYPFPALVNIEDVPPLITDGGRHGASAWAAHIAEWYLSPAPGVKGRGAEERAVYVDIVRGVLGPVFAAVIADERARLEAEGGLRLDAMVDRAAEAERAVDLIIAAAQGTVAEAYWNRPDLRRLIAIEIAHHLRTADFVERSWWADEHPRNNAAAAFKARHRRRTEPWAA